MTFAKQTYVDKTRAGGEPSVQMHPDGTYLYGAHAGTTHFFAPTVADEDSAAFFQNYRGQAYYWWSKDHGETWTFSDRTLPPAGVPGSGFSDPDFAVDDAGHVYISEINLVNVAVSKSTDSGKNYELQNFFGFTITDRQWMAADQKDVLYMVGNTFGGGTFPSDPVGNSGHILIKSKDGGRTFSEAIEDGGGLGDLQVDQEDGTLYEAHLDDGNLTMNAFRGARADDFKPDVSTIAKGVDMNSHWPAIDVDAAGNLYIVWDERGEGDRPAGVWYSYSTNRGGSWAAPVRVDESENTDLWPWLAVGGEGKIAIAWLEADKKLPDNDAETSGDHGWRIVAAQSLNGLGCGRSDVPGFNVVIATPDPVHKGTICNSGTICQAQGIDRRMGDYFTVEVDDEGMMWAGYSDTRQGGSVALPGFVRQSGGPSFSGR
ncbi:MAG: sialidase family protein [Actinomycetota bacterium]